MSKATRTVMLHGEAELAAARQALEAEEEFRLSHEAMHREFGERHDAMTARRNAGVQGAMKTLADLAGLADFDPLRWSLDASYLGEHGVVFLKEGDPQQDPSEVFRALAEREAGGGRLN